jgi:hypothetical protein
MVTLAGAASPRSGRWFGPTSMVDPSDGGRLTYSEHKEVRPALIGGGLGWVMAYTAPSGWIETRAVAGASTTTYRRFHQRQDCSEIQATVSLVASSRPYGVRRCKHCAG